MLLKFLASENENMAMSFTMNETIKAMSGLGWSGINRVMSLASKGFPLRCLRNMGVEKLSGQWETEFWRRVQLGIGIWGFLGIPGAKVTKHMRSHVEHIECKQRSERRAKPACEGLGQIPSGHCSYLLSTHCFQICQGHPTETPAGDFLSGWSLRQWEMLLLPE